jgi:hypothetical protein
LVTLCAPADARHHRGYGNNGDASAHGGESATHP